MKHVTLLFLVLTMILAACGGDDDNSNDTPDNENAADVSSDNTTNDDTEVVAAVESFLEARVNSDEDAMFESACADEEANLPTYAQSFASVTNVRIEDMACSVAQYANDSSAIVTCDGRIMADYGAGEENEFPLESYSVVLEDGVWKWCGETAAPEASG